MNKKLKLPDKKSVVFWPIGTGDSTTLVIRPKELVMQIDLRHLEQSENDDEPEWDIINHLVETLPNKAGKPYLASFALTHPDKDHIQGFAELLKRIHIGELWHTPRVFRNQTGQESLCDDAKAFRAEAERRRMEILKASGKVKSGDRLRIVGHDDILSEEKYRKIPDSCKSRPGDIVTSLDGVNLDGQLAIFIHAPFKDEQEGDKNQTSLSLNVRLSEGDSNIQLFFFGDRSYESIKRIFDVTEANEENADFLYWDIMLSAHHCSKSAMYSDINGKESLRKDIMELFEKYSRESDGYIIASSHSDFTDAEGKNPPHAKARKRYEEIVKSGRFICTHEYPSKKEPEPVVFTLEEDGMILNERRSADRGPIGLREALTVAAGDQRPSVSQVGFGCQ